MVKKCLGQKYLMMESCICVLFFNTTCRLYESTITRIIAIPKNCSWGFITELDVLRGRDLVGDFQNNTYFLLALSMGIV